MQLTILGAGTSVPVKNKSMSGYLLQIGATPILLDAGPGTITRLHDAGVSYRELDYVFVTHHHADHTLDLVILLQNLLYTPNWTRTRPLHITGYRGLNSFFAQMISLFGLEPKTFTLEIDELGETRKKFPLWTIETAFTGHTETSLAYRFESEDKVFVYTGDATEMPNLVHIARDADVFVCECAFPRGWQKSNHMTTDAVGRVAQQASVKRVILTHLYAPALEVDAIAQVKEEFSGHVSIAIDGMTVQV